jgi:hypothetical protein
MVVSASLQACGVIFPLAISTSICRSSVTICSALYLLIDMTDLPLRVNSLSLHLVPKTPVNVITGSEELHDISGIHIGMFFDPHVNQLASRLAACIDKASELAGREVHTPHEAAVNHPRPLSHVRA